MLSLYTKEILKNVILNLGFLIFLILSNFTIYQALARYIPYEGNVHPSFFEILVAILMKSFFFNIDLAIAVTWLS